ncbi:MAG: murein biosynthesis integral membrane protein MurJ [Casimicrobiaceae bacterium]|nr:murein biosynthesis integral membrane protein MurJ [Casimicrobiaceae bacterium]
MNILRAIFGVSALTTCSRVTGLAREVVMARVFGAGAANDAFEIAFQIPNMLRRMFAEGAFSQAFVPMLSEYRARRGEAATRQLIDRVATLQLVVLLAVSVLGMAAAPWIVPLIASGFDREPGKEALTVDLLVIMFPYILFISMVALAGGVLNVWKRFAVPAFSPVLLNLAMIGAALGAAPHFERPIDALAWGVIAGGVAQLALQLWALARLGLFPRWCWAPRDEGVLRVLKNMGPALLGVSVAQISLVINSNYASHFGTGAVSWLKKADRLMELPTALLGVAIGTVILPALGALRARGQAGGYSGLLDWGLRFSLLATLPAMAAMGLLALPMVSVLFERGAFTAVDSLRTASAVTAYAVGIVAIVAIKILAPAFYAQQDLRTPVRIAIRVLVVTQLFNLGLVFLLFRRWAPEQLHAALALSTSLGAILNAWWLYRGLRRHGLYVPAPGWRRFLGHVVLATSVAAIAVAIALPPQAWWHEASEWLRIVRLGLVLSLGAIGYLATLALLGYRPRDLRRRIVLP